MDAEGALGHLFLNNQVEAGLPDLRFAELIGSPSVVLGQRVDGCEITLLGLGSQAPQL